MFERVSTSLPVDGPANMFREWAQVTFRSPAVLGFCAVEDTHDEWTSLWTSCRGISIVTKVISAQSGHLFKQRRIERR